MKKQILIVDSDKKYRDMVSRIIAQEGFEPLTASQGAEALKIIASKSLVAVICNIKLADINGLQLVLDIKNDNPDLEVIIIAEEVNMQDGIQAIKNGAFDYISKINDNIRIIPLLNRILEKQKFTQRMKILEKKVSHEFSFDNLIGKSPKITEAIKMARLVAETQTTVLLTGETGTGKEVFAKAIHYGGERSEAAFIAINCASFTRDLLESELFGYKAGAFTGAVNDKKGLIEAADEGTLFLDEIGEMPLELQAKLLRVLESKEFIKLGDTESVNIDVRIIAATNRNLLEEVKNGKFRSDLYYRLSVFEIHIPSLRERISDIKYFVDEFANMFATKMNKKINRITSDYIEVLEQYQWNGNIRELRNVIERSIIMCKRGILCVQCMPYEIRFPNTILDLDVTTSLREVEKAHIKKVLCYAKNNKTEAANLLGIGVATLYRKMKEYGF